MRNIDYYLSLNYHKRLYQEDGDWIVEVDDLPGCIADGPTPDEAISNLREAMKSWIASRMEAGLDIPEPSVVEDYSGRILLRMPKFLHRRLSLQAKDEGVSLNQYLVSLLVDASVRATAVEKILVSNVALSSQCSRVLGLDGYLFNSNMAEICGNYLSNCGISPSGAYIGEISNEANPLLLRQRTPMQLSAIGAPKESA